MNRREIALNNEILRGVVGSGCHGTAIDGQDDRDEMGVFVEPPSAVCGLSPCNHYIFRTQPEDVRSGPGDLDLTMYSLRRYVGLAVQGNPTILLLVWLQEHITKTELGQALIDLRPIFYSHESGKRFMGYLRQQKLRLTGERARTTSRPELVAKYGYDTKFAMHALRLGYQGIEYMRERRISLPVPEPALTVLRAVRGGEVPFDDAVQLIEDAEARLRTAVSNVDVEVDRSKVDQFLVMAHRQHWGFFETIKRHGAAHG